MANETKTQTLKDMGRDGYQGDADCAVVYQSRAESIPMLLGKIASGLEPFTGGCPVDMRHICEYDACTSISVFHGQIDAPREAREYVKTHPDMRAKLVRAGVLAEAVR